MLTYLPGTPVAYAYDNDHFDAYLFVVVERHIHFYSHHTAGFLTSYYFYAINKTKIFNY
jgi:hypothetical protein